MNTKICSKCDKNKSLNDFPFKNKEKNIYHSACKECWKVIRKKSYDLNKKTTFERNRRNKKRNKNWYVEYKSNLKCEKCGETHPACLDFHHISPNEKETEISLLINNTISFKKIQKEIDKCIVLCANCHRKHHYNNI